MEEELANQKTDPDLAPVATDAAPPPAAGRHGGWFGRWFARLVFGIGFVLVLFVTVAVSVLRPDRPLSPVETPEGMEAAQRLREIRDAQEKHREENGAYTRDLSALGIEAESANFKYRVYLRSNGETFAAYARWKDPARSPRRFLQIDPAGKISEFNRLPRRMPKAKQAPPQAPAAPPQASPSGP